MKKVAILHYATPPVVGGVESTIDHHARLLAQRGYGIEIITGRGDHFHPGVNIHLVPEIDSRYPQTLDIGQELAQGTVSKEFKDLRHKIFNQLKSLLTGVNICIVHNAVTLHKNLALTAALRLISDEGIVPLIAWCHDFAWQDTLYTNDLHAGYPWDLLRTAWPGVSYVAVSEHRRSRLSTLLGMPESEIDVITPGVNPYEFLGIPSAVQFLAERLGLLDSGPLLLLPARIMRRKNIELSIRVTACLREYYPKTQLIVTGPPGPHNPKNAAYLESLKSIRKELDMDSAVHFLYEYSENGQALYLADEEVGGFYRLSDALLFLSSREGFGIPVLEAGLLRLPVFASDIPPIRESAANLARLFNVEQDPEVTAQAVAESILEYLQQDQAYRLKQRVMASFTWQAIISKQIIPLVEKVMQRKLEGEN